jgi:hypothetical protein
MANFYPMLSMLRNGALFCVVYFHFVCKFHNNRDKLVVNQLEPALLGTFFAISGYLHRKPSLRRMSRLLLLVLSGACFNAVAIFGLHDRSGLLLGLAGDIIWQMWFVICLAVIMVACTYFRTSNCIVVGVGLLVCADLVPQRGFASSVPFYISVMTFAMCSMSVEAMEWLDTRRAYLGATGTGMSTWAMPWALLGLPNIGYILVALSKFDTEVCITGYFRILIWYWCYVLGYKLQSPIRFECFAGQVHMMRPFFAIAYFYFAVTETPELSPFRCPSLFDSVSRSVRMVILVSTAMSCIRDTGRTLWVPSLDHATLLAYVSQGLLIAIVGKLADRLGIDVHNDGFCILATIITVGVCWVVCVAIRQGVTFARGCLPSEQSSSAVSPVCAGELENGGRMDGKSDTGCASADIESAYSISPLPGPNLAADPALVLSPPRTMASSDF